jgi:RHS repeat-associated protein
VYGLGLVSQVSGANTYYYLSDGLGSTMAMVDGSGTVVKTYGYDVYGKVTSSSGSVANEFDFAGQQTDPTGLQYLRARYYDTETGRFLSRDPLSASPGWIGQPFAYGSANPALMTDPLGLDDGPDLVPSGLNPCNWTFVNKKICGRAVEIKDELADGWNLVGEYFKKATDLDSYMRALKKLADWSQRCALYPVECGFALKNLAVVAALYTFAAAIVTVGCAVGVLATGPGGVLLCVEAFVAAGATVAAATLILEEFAPEELSHVGRREEH